VKVHRYMICSVVATSATTLHII